jgi:RNA polymerase sigma-70 factor (ECF subfamily)
MNADQSLIEQIKSGDQGAFAQLISDHKNYVYSICMGILRDSFEAEEATQDSFLKFYRSAAKIELNVKLRTYLYKIAYRTALDYLRKRKRVISLDNSHYDVAADVRSENMTQKKDNKRFLLKALSELKPDEAAIVTLFYFKELSINEIKEITGLSVSNIKIKLMRSRSKLAKIISDKYQFLKPEGNYG